MAESKNLKLLPKYNDGSNTPDSRFANAIARGAALHFYHVPTKKKVLFKAFLKSHGENYNAKWSGDEAYGRMDEIQKYKGTTRKIKLSFEVAAESEADSVVYLERLSQLIRMQYPSYDMNNGTANTINSSPLMRIKFGNLVMRAGKEYNGPVEETGLLGVMDGVNWDADQSFGYFNPYPGEFYPRLFTISFNFTAIHEHSLGFVGKREIDQYFEVFPFQTRQLGAMQTPVLITSPAAAGLIVAGIMAYNYVDKNYIEEDEDEEPTINLPE